MRLSVHDLLVLAQTICACAKSASAVYSRPLQSSRSSSVSQLMMPHAPLLGHSQCIGHLFWISNLFARVSPSRPSCWRGLCFYRFCASSIYASGLGTRGLHARRYLSNISSLGVCAGGQLAVTSMLPARTVPGSSDPSCCLPRGADSQAQCELRATMSRRVQAVHGNKWSVVAQYIPGRTGQQCAQRWRHKVRSSVVSMAVLFRLWSCGG